VTYKESVGTWKALALPGKVFAGSYKKPTVT
jgi:hypothetical protein